MNNNIKINILSGIECSNLILQKIKDELQKIKNENSKYRPPMFAIIEIGNNPSSTIYINKKKRIAENLNFQVQHYQFDKNDRIENISQTIVNLNHNKLIDGIIIQLPIANEYKHLIYEIAPEKDIDGLGLIQQANLALNKEGLRPCTPLGIIHLMKYYNINLHQNMCIVGCSVLVGQSLALMLLHEGATVTITHTLTPNLTDHIKKSKIIFLAAGHPGLINSKMLSENAIVFDIGITKMNNMILGDFANNNPNYKLEQLDYAHSYTPVPGGVGPMTVATLMQNVFKAYKKNSLKK